MPNGDTSVEDFALIWGAGNIGAEIGLTERQAFYLLEAGRIPSRKVGGKWCAERGTLRRFFLDTTGEAA